MMTGTSTLSFVILVLLKPNTSYCSFTQIVKPGEKLEWWQTTVIYQILPFSFKDSNGDGIGDFNGITNTMDYFTDTGIGTLWLTPFYKSPMLDAGYDIVDHEQVNPLFGKLADFDRMVKKIKAKGLNLIVDFVPNHTSDQHEWFKKSVRKESPYDDYYIWRDASSWNGSEPSPPNNWVNQYSRPSWTWHKERKQFYYHQFAPFKPDLNYWNPKVRNRMKDVLRFWLNRGIDGVKIDSMAHLAEDPYFRDEPVVQPRRHIHDYERYNHTHTLNHDENFMLAREFRAVLDEYKKRDGKTRLMTVDARGPTKHLMKYCGNDSNVGTHFPINFNLMDVDHQWKATDLAKAVRSTWDNLPPGCWPNWIVSSHDHPRFKDRVGTEMADASNMLTLLLPGTAITYYGDEIGMEDYKALGKENLAIIDKKDFFRTPFQWDDSYQAGFSTATKTWLPVNPNFWNVNLARAKRDENSHYKVYKRLVETRQTPTGQYGDLLTYVPSEWVFAFTRVLHGQPTYLTMINMGTEYAYVQPTKMIPNTTDTLIVQSASLNSGYSNGEVIPLIQHGKHLDFMMRPKSSVVLMTNDEQVAITPPGYRLPGSTNGPMYLPPPPTYLPPYPPGPGPGPERPKVDPDNSFGMGVGPGMGAPPGPGFGFNPDWMTNDRMKPPFVPPMRPSRTTVPPDSKPKNGAPGLSIGATVLFPLLGALLFRILEYDKI